MKKWPWVASAGAIGCLVFMLEVPRHIHGPEWAVALAGLCVMAVGMAGVWWIAGWADRKIKDAQAARERR